MRRKKWRSERKRVPVRCCKIEADAKKKRGRGGIERRTFRDRVTGTTRRRGREEKKRKKRVTCVEGRNVLEYDKREGGEKEERDRQGEKGRE